MVQIWLFRYEYYRRPNPSTVLQQQCLCVLDFAIQAPAEYESIGSRYTRLLVYSKNTTLYIYYGIVYQLGSYVEMHTYRWPF